MKGLQVVAADRQEGPSGARFRAEGWTELADVVSARGSLDAYVASLERDRFSPVRPDWREDYSCAPRPEQELFACHYEAHRRGPRGHERLSLVAKGVDTILKADGSRLGEGMKVEVHWDRTPL